LVLLEAPVTVRALARHAGVSPQGSLTLVNELSEAGLVTAERVGPALMLSLNREHLAAEPLIALVKLRGRLVSRLTQWLAGWRGLAGAWLFGSAARGEGGRDSDVDLLLVADATTDDVGWQKATAELRNAVRLWTGNEVQLVEHSRASLAELVDTANPFIAAVRDHGIALTAPCPELLRRRA